MYNLSVKILLKIQSYPSTLVNLIKGSQIQKIDTAFEISKDDSFANVYVITGTHLVCYDLTSDYCSPIVLTKKKDGTDRFCVDFLALNKVTITRKFPMPVIDEVLTSVSGNVFFTVLDLASGYHQIVMEEQSKKFTAFSTDKGCYEFNMMPFGLVNAPAHFQACMNHVKARLRKGDAEVYLDDTIIASKTVE